MADPPSHPDTGDDAAVGRDRGSPTGRPRWLPVLGITIAIVLFVLMVGLHLTGTIGPGGH
mgnify:CR=1 FL=1